MTERKRVQQVPVGASKTHQSFEKDANINNMAKRHLGHLGNTLANIGNPNATRKPIFGDFSNIDYHGMLNTVTQIDSMFASLPARVRGTFKNRPELLLDFIAKPENVKEAVRLRLIDDPEVIQEVLEAEQIDLEQQAAAVGSGLKADPEAQPSYTPPKGGTPPAGG